MRKITSAAWPLGLALALANVPASRAAQMPPLPRANTQDFLPEIRNQIQVAYREAESHPNDAQANGRLGMVFHAYHQLKSAERCYRRAHLLDGGSYRWDYYLGVVEQAQGENDRAVYDLKRALQLNPDYVPAQLALAETLRAQARWDESRVIYEAVLRNHSENAIAEYGLGRVFSSRGEAPKATASLRKACNLEPHFGAAHYALALAYKKLGEEQKAAEQFAMYQKFRNDSPVADDPLMREVYALDQSGLDAMRQGIELERRGLLTESAAAHEKALALDPNLMQAHVNLISLYARLSEDDKAEEHYRAAIRLDPHSADAYYDYGVLEMKRGNLAEAEQAYRSALECNRFYPEAHNNLGDLLERQGKLDEAAEQFRLAIANKPDYRRAHFHLGRILVNEEKYPEAIEELKRTLSPEDEETPAYLYALGAAYARAGQDVPALRFIRQAREQAAAYGQTRLLTSIDRDLKLIESREGKH